MNEYRYRFKLSDESACPDCPSPMESPEHIIFACPKYDQLRSEHLQPNKIERKEVLAKLNNREAADGFIAFCEGVVRSKIDRSIGRRSTD